MSGAEPETPTAFRLPRRAVYWLLAGLAIREAFSFWTGHPYDLESFLRTGFVVAHGGDPYAVSASPVVGASFAYLGQGLPLTAYPPFWPELLGGLFALWQSVGAGDRFVLYALLKQPGILGDLAVAFLLWRLAMSAGVSEPRSTRLLAFWSTFPYSIAISAVWGQFDSLVLALLLASVVAGRSAVRGLCYGLGILAKWILIVLTPLEFFRGRGKARLSVLLALGVPAAVGALPFLLQGWSLSRLFTIGVYEGHGSNYGMNYAYLLTFPYAPQPSAAGRVAYEAVGYLWVPVAVVAGARAAGWVKGRGARGELRALLFVLTAVLLVRWGLYEQYFLYVFALMALDLAIEHPARRSMFLYTVGLASAQLLLNNDLGLRFLAPAAPALWPYLMGVEAGEPWGGLRAAGLAVLAVAMTAALFQWLVIFYRDEQAPQPWPMRLFRRRGS